MREKNQAHSKQQKMQKLLDRQTELEAELQRCEDNIDLFEEYYLQNSWRTEITEFINRPRAKKNTKPYVEIADHQKIFSLSSVSSKPFINVSKVSYLATKDLHHETQQKIPRSGNQSKKIKASNERPEKVMKLQERRALKYKEEEDEEESEEEDEEESEEENEEESEEEIEQEKSEREGSEFEKHKSENLKDESSEDEDSGSVSHSDNSEQQKEVPFSKSIFEKIKQEDLEGTCEKKRDTNKQVSFTYRNEKRAISVERQIVFKHRSF